MVREGGSDEAMNQFAADLESTVNYLETKRLFMIKTNKFLGFACRRQLRAAVEL